jgi:nicotinamidase-related amidase
VATNLDLILRTNNIENLIFTGITTDVCVHTTMREANDMGYECLLLSDCTGATDYGNYEAALKMVKMQGGVFGSVATSEDLLGALSVL